MIVDKCRSSKTPVAQNAPPTPIQKIFTILALVLLTNKAEICYNQKTKFYDFQRFTIQSTLTSNLCFSLLWLSR